MTRPRTIVCGSGDTATSISYLQSRHVLQLRTGSTGEGRELSLDAFCDELGIQREALTPPRYLLFAGSGRGPAGGYRDLVATYNCPKEARQEFTAWRRDAGCQWAELVSFCEGRIVALCWFGVDRVDRTLPARSTAAVPLRRRPWRRRGTAQAPPNA